jgi:hypothetical protein
MTQEHLFDPEPYTTGATRQPRPPRPTSDVPMEPLAPGWTYLRDRKGVLPYAHLVATATTWGAAVTRCGQMGTRITDAGVEVMRRCPGCDMDLQLD